MGRARVCAATGLGRCPGAAATTRLTAWRPWCAAPASPALRRWAARAAEVLAPEVVSGTAMSLPARPAIRAGPLGEARPITAARPGRYEATAWKSDAGSE